MRLIQRDLDPLLGEFKRDSGCVRALLILSPT
jgi:hypothetical protein